MSDIEYRKLERKDIDRFIELRKMQLLDEGAKAMIDITDSLFDFYKRYGRKAISRFWFRKK